MYNEAKMYINYQIIMCNGHIPPSTCDHLQAFYLKDTEICHKKLATPLQNSVVYVCQLKTKIV